MSQINRLIPIQEAAKQFNVSEESLMKLVDQGAIKAVMLPDGGIAVNAEISDIVLLNARLLDIKRSDFDFLNESLITVAEAEQKYSVPDPTIRIWIQNAYIKVETGQYPSFLNEGDLAYCVAIYKERKRFDIQHGAPLLDINKYPYLIRSPYQAEHRRRKKS